MAAVYLCAASTRADPVSKKYEPIRLPEPTPIAREDREATEYVSHYTGRLPILVGPGLRLAPAASLRLNDSPHVAFALDAISGMRIGLHHGNEQWVLVPELGWSWRTPGAEQLLSAGIGLGYGEGDSRPSRDARTSFAGLSYIPRFLLELDGPERAPGLRNGLLLDFAENTIAAELSHQVLWKPSGAVHDVRIGVSVDLGLVIWMLVLS